MTILFPFNIISLFTYHILKRNGVKADVFFDNDVSKQNKTYDGVTITPPYSVIDNSFIKNNVSVILCSWISRAAIQKQLENLGIKKIVDYNEIWDAYFSIDALNDINKSEIKNTLPEVERKLAASEFEIYKSYIPKFCRNNNGLSTKLIIPTINLRLSSFCNLKCKDCISLMQYYKKPRHFDYDITKKSFERFMSFVDHCGFITIMGGEPLMYPRLSEVINWIGRLKNTGAVMLVTNGTLLPDKKLIAALGKNKVYVRVSNYGELSRKKNELITLLKENGVNAHIYDYTTGWLDCNKIIDGDARTEAEVKKTFLSCNISCPSFIENKFFICEFMAFADDLSAIPADAKNYIDVSYPELTKQMIIDYTGRKDSAEALNAFSGCRYCSGSHRFNDQNAVMVPSAIQITEPLKYKLHKDKK